jgi:hypothetical protein
MKLFSFIFLNKMLVLSKEKANALFIFFVKKSLLFLIFFFRKKSFAKEIKLKKYALQKKGFINLIYVMI